VPLLDAATSQLIVVDLQPGFYPPEGVDGTAYAAAEARAAWLVGVAATLGIPVTLTEEDAVRNGPTSGLVMEELPLGTAAFDKTVFGLADQADILAAVAANARPTVVLVGTETDVCVAQSAIGLVDRGYGVVVVTDATFSPGEAHAAGLRRASDGGALLLHAKGVYYEWIRTLADARAFQEARPDLAEPPGFRL
jgi:nicotinamidase-related amidase